MDYSDVLSNARQNIGKYCKACPVCNGVACKNQIPGPGAKGVGDTAIRNYNKWADIRVNMDTLCENGTLRMRMMRTLGRSPNAAMTSSNLLPAPKK